MSHVIQFPLRKKRIAKQSYWEASEFPNDVDDAATTELLLYVYDENKELQAVVRNVDTAVAVMLDYDEGAHICDAKGKILWWEGNEPTQVGSAEPDFDDICSIVSTRMSKKGK